ncbi:PREDICTED: organic cation transporter 1-like [Nicrophorus vespilloides]|uniref:Organic cation transporter 1-like n=1 Tax=Nicrophorus vespilloides TaxID=110193 RepID=A0ABM1NKG2_NICVS|nr:PREDICTED: organic cation transporter 1-like [Nicrophorus vespilloides]
MDEDTSEIDAIIESVGNEGKFQYRFYIIFSFLLPLFAAMPTQNFINALAIPDHWCFVPGREFTNFTLGEWKLLHLPKEYDSIGVLGYSKCKMFNGSSEVIKCQHGWEFDKTWYEMTIPMQKAWVCDDSFQVTNTFIFSKIGEAIGTFIFGQLADTIGRKPVFFMSVMTVVVGRMLLIFTSFSTILFFLAMSFGSFSTNSILQSPLITGLEISKTDKRARIAMIHSIGGTIGYCILPLAMWWLNDWKLFTAVTTLPCILFMLTVKFFIESPRWLASKGKTSRCVKELGKIAKINGKELPENLAYDISNLPKEDEKVYGVLGLFSSWRLSKNTLCLMSGWASTTFIFVTLTFNVTNLEGNPFMNFFWQGAAELPAWFIGKYACDKIGRRWTNISAFLATFVGCLFILVIIHDETQQLTVSAICVFLKFCVAFASYVVNLQSMEIYPTCIRQVGISLGGILANVSGIMAPYVVFLGIEIDASYPYALSAILGFLGIIFGLFLPETLNHKLPETLTEAAAFGANQNFFGKEKRRDTVDQYEMSLKS